MEQTEQMEQIDAPRRVLQSLEALKSLLDVATGHDGVPAPTRHCLVAMAACVRELSEACTSLEQLSGGGLRHGTGSSESELVDLVALERRGSALRELLGADLIEQLDSVVFRPTVRPVDSTNQSSEPSGPKHPPLPARANLTRQEQRILELVARGCTNRQIATQLYLAEKTVKNYVSNMLRKLGMERRTQAAVYAIQLDRAVLADATSGYCA